MKDNFNHHAWKLKQLQEDIRKEVESYIDGIIPLIKKINFYYTDYGSLYKIQVYDDKGDELTVKDKDDYRGERRFNSDDVRYVAKKLGIQVNDNFGGRGYDYNYYEDLISVFDNIGIELDHDDSMDVS
ncbi:MAG: hypothetical protein H8E16_17960 [Flavobacteriales bacterium]|nr:hypothetical protein [Flavobacteriales bacterium]